MNFRDEKICQNTNRQGEHFLSPYYDKYIDNSTYSCYTFIDIYFKINLSLKKHLENFFKLKFLLFTLIFGKGEWL